MTEFETLSLALTAIAVIVGPSLLIMVRGAIKWTRVEDRLDRIASDLEDLVTDKNKIHKEIADQMHEDRKATNERLTWLERHLWIEKGQP